MPICETKYFGTMEYSETSAFEFPRGLPGFDHECNFILIEHPTTQPLVYLQSLTDAALCFVAAPMNSIMPDYKLEMAEEDIGSIGLDPQQPPVVGNDVICLAIVSIREGGPTANLMAPIVASLTSRKAVQAIAGHGRYSHQHPLEA